MSASTLAWTPANLNPSGNLPEQHGTWSASLSRGFAAALFAKLPQLNMPMLQIGSLAGRGAPPSGGGGRFNENGVGPGADASTESRSVDGSGGTEQQDPAGEPALLNLPMLLQSAVLAMPQGETPARSGGGLGARTFAEDVDGGGIGEWGTDGREAGRMSGIAGGPPLTRAPPDRGLLHGQRP